MSTLQRVTHFSAVKDRDMNVFESIVSPKNIITESSELEPLNTDWQRRYKGDSKVALFPTSTEEVSAILAYCNERKIAVVP